VPDAAVVQMIGAVGHGDPLIDGAELARWLAQKLSATYHYISAPLLVEDEAVAQALLRERSIAESLALAARVEVAVIGIGTVDARQSSLQRAGYLDAADLTSLAAAGAVGDVMARHLDADGRLLDCSMNRRVIGLEDLHTLQRIPAVMGIAGGALKAPAILAALRGRFVKVLVTDANTASEILALHRAYGHGDLSPRRWFPDAPE
jgi:deoxyribonucleoside regulator